MAFIEQKENDNNDNLCKIHGGLYIASALMKTKKQWRQSITHATNLGATRESDVNAVA